MESDRIRGVELHIEGRVQGVGFRAWSSQRARRLGITGTVRNCMDGSVEIRAEGTEAQIDAFISALRSGNGYIQVDTIKSQSIPINGFHTFSIEC